MIQTLREIATLRAALDAELIYGRRLLVLLALSLVLNVALVFICML